MERLTSQDLERWATDNARDCQENLPLLVRKLIRATATNIGYLNFPAGDNVYLPGWDGKVEASEGYDKIPNGISCWEIGTGKRPSKKASDDFELSLKKHLNYEKSDCIYVFVTPYNLNNKSKVKENITAEIDNPWKEVRVYDGTDLEEWLEQAPTVSVWLATHIGKKPKGVQSLENFWENWSYQPEKGYQLPPKIVTAGRENEVRQLSNFLKAEPSLLQVKANSKDEAIAFIVGAFHQMEDEAREDYFARSLKISDRESFLEIANNRHALILIPDFGEEDESNKAVLEGNHVLIPVGADITYAPGNQLELSPLDHKEFINALINAGFTEENAENYARETARNLTIFRRRFRFSRDMPEWADKSNVKAILPGLLLGRWDHICEGDMELLANFAEKDAKHYLETLKYWLNSTDAPFFQIGNKWRLASPLDAWAYLTSYLPENKLELLKENVIRVLTEKDPKLELEVGKRYMGQIHGKERKYSDWAREGITQSLVLFAVYGESFNYQGPGSPQSIIDGIVREIFDNIDGDLWKSISDVLPLLTEASPEEFLNTVEKSLEEDEPTVMAMFEESNDMLGSTSYHPSLLWALEQLQWFRENLSRVTIILGKLASLDPGGNLGNRPENSLRNIFLPWFPQTFVSLKERNQVLNKLKKEFPEITWDLVLKLLPSPHDTTMPSRKPRWRGLGWQTKKGVPYRELWENYSYLVDLSLSLADTNEHKLGQIFQKVDHLPPQEREKVCNYIEENSDQIHQVEFSIWHEIRKTLSHHNSHPNANWALPQEDLDRFWRLYYLFEPEDLVEKNLWMFNDQWTDEFPEGINTEEMGFEEVDKYIKEKREQALNEIYEEKGLATLLELPQKLEWSIALGKTTSKILKSPEAELGVLTCLKSEDEKIRYFVYGFIMVRADEEDLSWSKSKYQKLKEEGLSKEELVHFLLPHPQTLEFWQWLEESGKEIKQLYWQDMAPSFFVAEPETKTYGIKRLLEVNRPFSAMRVLSHFTEGVSTELILNVLEKGREVKSEDNTQPDHLDIERLFRALDNRDIEDEDRLARLEMFYLPILASHGSTRPPKALNNALVKDPNLFAEVISLVYKPKTEEKAEKEYQEMKNTMSDNEIADRAGNAWRLLDTFNQIPGADENNNIDEEELKEWIERARSLNEENEREDVGDRQIGTLLAKCPKNREDEDWPPEPICEAIEKLKNDKIKQGFKTELYNSRGVVTKAAFEGGNQDRALAEYYDQLAKNKEINYPQVAAIFQDLAKDYKEEAKREDERARREDLER